MSNLTDAWGECYAAQTAETGIAAAATITGYCAAAPALFTEVNLNAEYIPGSTAEGGGFTFSIRQSDMANEPPKGTPITCVGMGNNTTLKVVSSNLNGGIWYVQAGDIQS